jgi:channel protein (hemolysin III family)
MTGQSLPHVYSLPGLYEPFSVVSHLAGAAVFAVLGYRLIRRGKGNAFRQTVLAVYAASCVLLFATSGVYHMIAADTPARATLARLDHSAIFILIAGTFTPAHGILFRGWRRWAPLVLIWGAAIGGIVLKSVYFADLAGGPGILIYLFLGWLGAISGTWLALRYGFRFVTPILWGGIAYSIGALVEYMRWPVMIPGVIHSHDIFHLAVLVGACFHWSFIWRIAVFPGGPAEGVAAAEQRTERQQHAGATAR